MSRLRLPLERPTWSAVATTASMNASMSTDEARKLAEVAVGAPRSRRAARCSRRARRCARAPSASHAPNVGIAELELPHGDQLESSGSTSRIALAVSAASRPYSSAVFCPICHGPSISLPRHHSRDAVRLLGAVAAAAGPTGGAAGVVAVLDEVDGLLHAAGAEVDRHHRLDAGVAGPAHELVDADLVGLDGPPGQVEPGGSPVLSGRRRPPSGTGDEVAAGVAHEGDAELAGQVEHVLRGSRWRRRSGARARRCRCRRSGPCARRTSRTAAGRPRRR